MEIGITYFTDSLAPGQHLDNSQLKMCMAVSIALHSGIALYTQLSLCMCRLLFFRYQICNVKTKNF